MSRDMITPPAGFGTGSTAPEGEDNLQYLVMPSGIRIYEQCVPEWSRLFERAEETDLAFNTPPERNRAYRSSSAGSLEYI